MSERDDKESGKGVMEMTMMEKAVMKMMQDDVTDFGDNFPAFSDPDNAAQCDKQSKGGK